jgi:putative SOS response-associated peptidase YedK
MCGRYTVTVNKDSIERHFNAKFSSGSIDFEPTYNAAPSQLLPIITTYAPGEITLAKWGFVPEELKSSHIRPQNNARLETAAEKPMFRSSFSGRHCLVLTDGFYEWKTINGKKLPYRFVMKSGEPFAMAGIYARGEREGDPMTFAIVTTEANDVMRPVHDRMPVILSLGREKQWLPSGGVPVFNPFPAELMTAYPVTPQMNRASFNTPEAIRPLEAAIAA